mgnify:CR=1 FL=1
MERTHRIMFVCHGNICRSPMAEFLLKDMIKKEGLADRFVIASAGTSREEIGNPVHQGTRKKLAQDHISAAGKYAVQLTKEDYEKYDLILGMDRANISNILRIIGSDPQEKVHRLLDLPSCRVTLLIPGILVILKLRMRRSKRDAQHC